MDSSHTASSDFETFIQRGFLDNSKRKITINKEYIEFEDKNFINSENSRLYWKDFDGIRYGYERIRGYYFYIGLRRQIFIRDSDKNQIKISLTSLYNFRSKRNQEKFSKILQAIFNAFLTNHTANLIKLVKSGQTITLAGTQVSKDEIVFNIKKELIMIDFLVLNMASYMRYFYIYSEIDNEKGLRVDFLGDWNSMLLYSLIKNLLKK